MIPSKVIEAMAGGADIEVGRIVRALRAAEAEGYKLIPQKPTTDMCGARCTTLHQE